MLDGLLGRSGYSSKCKSLIKPTRKRIEVLRRRAEAKQRFLKEDLAKLLANGLDVNAYGRTEEFIGGLNLLSCYTFIDQSCEYILKRLSIMQKLGQCPEECRETVASLMFAAARFSDLPELRDLRDVFQERYGNGLECYVNQVFVEKIASKPPVVEKRIKLLQDIAAEFLIQWDSKGFKQRMDEPSTLAQDQEIKVASRNITDDKYKLPNNVFQKNNQRFNEKIEHTREGPTLHNDGNLNFRKKEAEIPFVKREEKCSKERTEHAHEGWVLNHNGNGNDRRKEELNIPFVKREEKHSKEKIEYNHEVLVFHHNGNGNGIPFVGRDEKHGYKHEELTNKPENGGYFSKSRQESDSKKNGFEKHDNINDHLFRSRHERRSPDKRPQVEKTNHEKSQGISNGTKEDDKKSTEKVKEEEPIKSNSSLPPPYVKLNIPPPYSKPHKPSKPELDHFQNNIPLPKPRSIRRKKHSKSSSSHDDIASSDDAPPRVVKRISSSRRKEKKGSQIVLDDQHYHNNHVHQGDEEEKMMDKLLLHYSKKPSAYDINKLRKKKSRSNKSQSPEEMIVPPIRSISLPHEHSGESEPKKKVYVRANSFQPDHQAPHVHPKLPDYDDLAARFAALRGR